ncbi:hypothetical protein RCL1_007239 [Eukaryota sp. TZLM3-RCL]
MTSPKSKFLLSNFTVILVSIIVSIVLHAVLPAPVDDIEFDSFLVRHLGFPVVAVSYFIILFSQVAIVIHTFGRFSNMKPLEIGLRFGMALGIIYQLGMQEIVVEATHFESWGFDFVVYQIFMGLADSLPTILLCVGICYFTMNYHKETCVSDSKKIETRHKIISILFFALTFFIQRTIAYNRNWVHSNIDRYPIQTLVWTFLFGTTLGSSYLLLLPVFLTENNFKEYTTKITVIVIGLNWIIFNSFIGFVFANTMIQMLCRSCLDVLVFWLTSLLVARLSPVKIEF